METSVYETECVHYPNKGCCKDKNRKQNGTQNSDRIEEKANSVDLDELSHKGLKCLQIIFAGHWIERVKPNIVLTQEQQLFENNDRML